jgi:hypothetical protein
LFLDNNVFGLEEMASEGFKSTFFVFSNDKYHTMSLTAKKFFSNFIEDVSWATATKTLFPMAQTFRTKDKLAISKTSWQSYQDKVGFSQKTVIPTLDLLRP